MKYLLKLFGNTANLSINRQINQVVWLLLKITRLCKKFHRYKLMKKIQLEVIRIQDKINFRKNNWSCYYLIFMVIRRINRGKFQKRVIIRKNKRIKKFKNNKFFFLWRLKRMINSLTIGYILVAGVLVLKKEQLNRSFLFKLNKWQFKFQFLREQF